MIYIERQHNFVSDASAAGYRLGLVSVSFRQNSPDRILSAAKAAGLSCIEWGADVHAPFDAPEKVSEIAELQARYGIKCSSYGSYFRIGESDNGDLPKLASAAKVLGTNVVRIWAGNKGSEQFDETDAEKFIKECRAVAQFGEENGIVFCLECHIRTFTDTKEAAHRLITSVNSPCFRMYWQPNQYKTEQENLEYARLIAPYTEHIHVFNWSGNDRFPLGTAIPQWKKYLSLFGGGKTLLLEFMPDGEISSLEAEAKSLRILAGEPYEKQ